jgi:hypothetical protein
LDFEDIRDGRRCGRGPDVREVLKTVDVATQKSRGILSSTGRSPKKVNSKVPEDISWVSLSGVRLLFASERVLATPVDFIAVGCREGGISLCTLVARLACLFLSCCS